MEFTYIKQRTKWKDEMKTFDKAEWSLLPSNREAGGGGGERQWTNNG